MTILFDSRQGAVDQGSEAQRRLVQALRDPACYPHRVGSISIIETHISFVVLTRTFAYKIKKSVDLGFLDFTTLEKRRFFCREELRLNARLAPRIYLDVVPIGGTREAPRVGDDARAIEYAVKMLEFPQEALADRVLARGELTSRHMDLLAVLVAQFHACSHRSREGDGYGTPEAILSSVAQNFSQIRAVPDHTVHLQALDDIETWTRQQHVHLRQVFADRKREGRVRECHGDLHLGNIVFLDGEPRAFDCIEFNPDLRWIDVMNEVAFLVMDLHAANRPDLARRFLNTYLEFSGDYGGLRVLPYYFAYRAMVRGKIGLIRARQLEPGSEGAGPLQESCCRHLELARSCARPGPGFIAITHGFSGSGKTTLSQSLVELTGAIRIRSDIERKRMHGRSLTDRPTSAVASSLYSADVTDTTYQRLLELAGTILESGHGVIVDATFLKRRHRDMFRALAANARVPFSIVDFTVGEQILRERIAARLQLGQDASDADLAVLEHQLATHEPLQAGELAFVFAYDASRPADDARRPQTWTPLLQRLSLPH
ncbi:MAG: AAA family ATPase [Betaproteobacteria bacterium]|nr:AAA family ATPase [Betaproteobacteria bacterium]